DRVYMDVACYNTRVMGAAHVANVTNLACRTALSRHGVAHINFPVDIQSMPLKSDTPSERNLKGHAMTEVRAHRAGLPELDELKRAAAVLNEGGKVAILAGQGALHATDELIAVAEKLGAPIVKALLGKACV